MEKIIIGIDEAGRGPWAGPLVVAGIATFSEKIFEKIPLLNDSKKISEKNREKIFEELQNLKKMGQIDFCIMEQSAEIIDKIGIREANRQAMQGVIGYFQNSDFCKKFSKNLDIRIDGADNFVFEKINAKYIFAKKKTRKKILQKDGENSEGQCEDFVKNISTGLNINLVQFIIGGDASDKNISAASILAKVHRDMIMKGFSKEFPEYFFEKNKGYGTKSHHEAILNYGINFLHRKTYEPIKTLISEKNLL